MKLEDYFKYYIQGSDHYLIPKDVFIELFEEMENWREEAKELKEQLEENKDKINWYENFEINKTIDKLRIKHNNQQKYFINYLENMLDDENDIFSVVRVKDVLQKYKETIGVSDEKEN
ncbi:MAG: hypothetical protein PUJ51_25335 [Clostridiales bacterium]|uniref:hypothetical protein n=1 Tax=Terrisporobacter sp. TaxID=1965305 RepID=UPI002A53E5BE|nr:hypothetical protein [Terrisporobacter sp.]MDD7757783.1 hypothetical protein [Clostridiales bacterium]MDY4135176.1 hypothetical protein [Terrisporobacter sp.]